MPSFSRQITVTDTHGEYDAWVDVEFSCYGGDVTLEHVTYTDMAGKTVDYAANDYDDIFMEAAYDMGR